MIRISKFAFAISALALLSAPALSQNNVEDVGGWSIETRARTDGASGNLCILRSPKAEASPTLQLVNGAAADSPRGSASLFVYVSELLGTGDGGDLAGARISVDTRKTWEVPTKWAKLADNQSSITATLDPQIDNVIKPLAFGNSLHVALTGQDGAEKLISVNLTGSSKALVAYEKCLSGPQG